MAGSESRRPIAKVLVDGTNDRFRRRHGPDADVAAGLDLAAHIDARSGIVADQYGREARLASLMGELAGAVSQPGADIARQRGAVDDACSHVLRFERSVLGGPPFACFAQRRRIVVILL